MESSWHMQESDAAYYKDAERIEGTLEIRKPSRSPTSPVTGARALPLAAHWTFNIQ